MNNALPKQVRDQIKAADEIIEKMENPDGTPLVEPAKEAAPEPAPEPAPEAPPKEADPDHKYKVLQGKYNAEVPRLQKTNNELMEQNRDLNQRILNVEGMMAALATTKEAPAKPRHSDLPDVTEDERAQFGDDLIDLVERVAKRATVPEIEARVEKVDATVQQQGQKLAEADAAVAQSKRQETVSALATAVPNWEAQNNDPAFLTWLNENEPSVGVPRGKLLTEAFRANDAQRVIWFFTSFPSENATETSTTAPENSPEPQTKLDELVAPGTPKTGSVVAPNESGKRVWTRNDIAALYAEKNEFIKRGKKVPDKLVKLERDLFKAQNEGRLR
ncbi:MAG: hypothetical protein ACYSSM_06350 [Planctomycetota bacterium]|jgi:hypothetical protein